MIHTSKFCSYTVCPVLEHDCAAIIPCFNEASQISRVVHEVLKHVPNVLVVDDGSTDDTAEKARGAGAKVIRHSANHGKGKALHSGWRYAREKGFSWVLMMDGDGQHTAADIPKFIECVEQTGVPLVVGNRMHRAESIPWLRRSVNRWISRELSDLTGVSLLDSQCGFRLVNLDVLTELALSTNRFEIESEMLVRFLSAKHRVEFVPIEVIYKNRASKINPVLDTWRWLRWRLGYSRLATFGNEACSAWQPAVRNYKPVSRRRLERLATTNIAAP